MLLTIHIVLNEEGCRIIITTQNLVAIAAPPLADELKPEEVLEEGEIVRRKAKRRRRSKTSRIRTVTAIRSIRNVFSTAIPHIFMTGGAR